MDCVDRAVYDFPDHLENNPEATRRAFVRLFNPESDDAMLVMKHLCGVLQWELTMISDSPTFNSQSLALKGVMAGIKQQLNMKPIEEIDTGEENE
jgi:hypothetical protein